MDDLVAIWKAAAAERQVEIIDLRSKLDKADASLKNITRQFGELQEVIEAQQSRLDKLHDELGLRGQLIENLEQQNGANIERCGELQSRLDSAAELLRDCLENYHNGLRNSDIENWLAGVERGAPIDRKALADDIEAVAHRNLTMKCAAACGPQSPRMGFYGICQLPQGHDGPHDSSIRSE